MKTLSTKSMSLSCQMLPVVGAGFGGSAGGSADGVGGALGMRLNFPEIVLILDSRFPFHLNSSSLLTTADGSGGGGNGGSGTIAAVTSGSGGGIGVVDTEERRDSAAVIAAIGDGMSETEFRELGQRESEARRDRDSRDRAARLGSWKMLVMVTMVSTAPTLHMCFFFLCRMMA